MSTLEELRQAVVDAAVTHMADPHAIGYVQDIRDRSSDDLTFLALAEAVEALHRGPTPDVWQIISDCRGYVGIETELGSALSRRIDAALAWHGKNPDA